MFTESEQTHAFQNGCPAIQSRKSGIRATALGLVIWELSRVGPKQLLDLTMSRSIKGIGKRLEGAFLVGKSPSKENNAARQPPFSSWLHLAHHLSMQR
ncbi:MAG: hypothetical protein ACREQO_01950 [Candidatus Binatia bacterium]